MSKSELSTMEKRTRQIMRVALGEGIVTDHISDGACEQLLREGWLERAAPVAPRPHVSRSPAYLPTEKAIHEWNDNAGGKRS